MYVIEYDFFVRFEIYIFKLIYNRDFSYITLNQGRRIKGILFF